MHLDIDSETKEKWQKVIDALAVTFDVPSVLIMHVNSGEISVFSSCNSKNNPYEPGMSEHLEGSGLYCEWVIKNQSKLLVPDALEDPDWDHNPDIKLNMISYLGYPVNYPDGTPFGTMCILDNKKNTYSEKVENLLQQIKGLIEDQLLLIYQKVQLVKTIHGIIPMCASCKRIRTDNDQWIPIAEYISKNSSAQVSHGLCKDCAEQFMQSSDF